MQAKRIQVLEIDRAVNTQVNVVLDVPTEPREEVNFHNIWGGISAEPVNADANAQGNWVLLILRDATQAILNFTDANINLETSNQDIIACGVWGASNQTPFGISINPKTSRNLPAGGRLILACHVTGVTSGNVSIKCMLCAHTVRK